MSKHWLPAGFILVTAALATGRTQDAKEEKQVAELQALVKNLQKQLEATQVELAKTKNDLDAAQLQAKLLRERLTQLETIFAKKGAPPMPPKVNPPAAT